MISTSTERADGAAATRRRDDERADGQRARRFQELLNQPTDEPPPLAPPPPPWWQELSPEGALRAGRSAATAQTALAPPAPVVAALPPEALALRVSTGPLAGLMVQLGWRADHLALRLSNASPALARRLATQQQALVATLGAALGVKVQLELDHVQR